MYTNHFIPAYPTYKPNYLSRGTLPASRGLSLGFLGQAVNSTLRALMGEVKLEEMYSYAPFGTLVWDLEFSDDHAMEPRSCC